MEPAEKWTHWSVIWEHRFKVKSPSPEFKTPQNFLSWLKITNQSNWPTVRKVKNKQTVKLKWTCCPTVSGPHELNQNHHGVVSTCLTRRVSFSSVTALCPPTRYFGVNYDHILRVHQRRPYLQVQQSAALSRVFHGSSQQQNRVKRPRPLRWWHLELVKLHWHQPYSPRLIKVTGSEHFNTHTPTHTLRADAVSVWSLTI